MSGNVKLDLRLQKEALSRVSKRGGKLSEAMDSRSLSRAVAIAGEIAAELKTVSVSSLPVNLYNDVYAAVCQELRRVERWIVADRANGMAEEALRKAQEDAQIVPRLFVTTAAVGACCEVHPDNAPDLFSELMDLLGGVQHPWRGVFLRAFVTQQLRNHTDLLETPTAMRLLLRNLAEMTRLWVRIDRKQEMRDVKVLVGQALSAIGRLDMDIETYERTVLPRLIEMILSCPDAFAQEYLAECIVQVFSDELHLNTLDSLLGMCQTLSRGVRLRVVISALTDRLGVFVSQSAEGAQLAEQVDAFESLASHLPAIENRMGDKLSVVDRLGMYLALLRYSLRAEPNRLDSVDRVLGFVLAVVPEEGFEPDSEPETQVGYALTEPLIARRSVAAALKLENFHELAARLSPPARRTVAATMLKSVTDFPPCVSEVGDLERLFELVGSLVEDQSADDNSDEDDEEAQTLVARIVFLLDDTDPDRFFRLLEVLRSELARGGVQRARFTFPSLVMASLRLAVRVSGDARSFLLVCEFAMETIGSLAEADPLLALRLYLEGLTAAATCGIGAASVAYEFVSHAIILYEDQLGKVDRAAFDGFVLVLGGIGFAAQALSEEDYNTLANRLYKHAVLLPDHLQRCIGLCYCARIFWTGMVARGGDDGDTAGYDKRIRLCLSEARELAMDRAQPVDRGALLLEVYNNARYLVEVGCPLEQESWVGHQLIGHKLEDTIRELLFSAGGARSPYINFSRKRFDRLVAEVGAGEKL